MKKIGFLFGAGAEISYGMPTGGKFALEIFRRDITSSKNIFKDNRRRIDSGSQYASEWLPQDYEQKKVSSFRESVFENIIRDTVSNNRVYIVDRINKFDEVAKSVLRNENKKEEDFKKQIRNDLGKNFSDINVRQQLKYNQFFNSGNALFSSNYFAILLTYYKDFDFENSLDKELLGDLIKSIFQLHIGALSEDLSKNLQENIFDKDEIELDIFDDLGGNLSVNYQAAGVKGLELLSKSRQEGIHNIVNFTYDIIEKIYADVLDYKSVIDSNWHYLYIPKNEWGKFCRISIFLHSVREYIKEECSFDEQTLGYYDDLEKQKEFEISTIATSNYVNDLIGNKLPSQTVLFLNGSINDYYDPYMNSMISAEEFKEYDKFAVPLIFTQSGTKPMTSIDMSIKYVKYYQNLKDSDYICSIGFGFNTDDEHINGIIRTLVERDNKKLLVIDLANEKTPQDRVESLSKKLKITKSENIKLIIVDKNRKVEGKNWSEYIAENDF